MDLSIQQPSRQERRRGRPHELPLRRPFDVPQIGEMPSTTSVSVLAPVDPARGARLPQPPVRPRSYASPLQGVPLIAGNCH
jgi:hypothetical protein